MKPDKTSPWLRHPVVSVMVGGAWLLLQQSVAVPQLITAALLALLLPRLLDGFLGVPTRPRALGTALHLAGVVLWDIVISNVIVARIVLTPWSRPQPAWVPVALDVQSPTSITLLAAIITTTPGTVSCVVDDERRMILVHALDCSDAAALAADIKARYEAPLKEIFG